MNLNPKRYAIINLSLSADSMKGKKGEFIWKL